MATKEDADLVALTIMNTNTAGLSGAIVVAIIMQIVYKKLDLTMILNGALGGLVATTTNAPPIAPIKRRKKRNDS
jgi:Amt family ammonium transporter